MKKIVKSPIMTQQNNMVLSSPITVHIELTYSCCFNCRHCYNFWRKDKSKPVFMSINQLDRISDELIANNSMHVIFTGGEPLLNYSLLIYGINRMKEGGLSVSCNSSLSVANSIEQLKRLKEVGLEHILTSLNSHMAEVNDYLVSTPGAHKRIIQGIKNAVSAGIRVSVNMIISKSNIKHIYETGKLVHALGAKKFFGTRVVPNLFDNIEKQKEFWLLEEEARYVLNELLKVQADFGLQIGTLVPFPFCFMIEDYWEKYANFYSHGCPAGNKMISINANGDTHACVHESKSYGNIFEIGIKGVWENMKEWRKGEVFPDACKACSIFDECNGGCRLCALTYKGDINAADNLRKGWDKKKPMPGSLEEYKFLELEDIRCFVPQSLRFRKEDGFYVVHRFGSEILCVKNEIAEFLRDYQKKQEVFSPAEVGIKDVNMVKKLLKEDLLVLSHDE